MTTEQLATSKLIEAIDELVKVRVEQALRSNTPSGHLDPRALRVSRGLELIDVSAKSGISHTTLSRLERGLIKRPKPDTMNRAARAIGVSESQYREAVAALIQRGAACQ